MAVHFTMNHVCTLLDFGVFGGSPMYSISPIHNISNLVGRRNVV